MRQRLHRTWAAAAAGSLVIVTTATLNAAGTASANLAVSATVPVNCTIATAPLAFGAYDPVVANDTADLDATGTVTIACTKGSTAQIGLGAGSNASGSTRRMADGAGNFLSYELYQDTTRATVWGGSGSGLLSPSAAPSKAARNFTVFGRVSGAQDVPSGTYSDTVVATVNF